MDAGVGANSRLDFQNTKAAEFTCDVCVAVRSGRSLAPDTRELPGGRFP